ncbi:LacI family DNA-binding transcriptional regulator [Lentzea nigeriaca]|uniref:LacI family DNA-binding transcriptional regulator n=1 Tax=Lentzea nigeriaca TaxID=1128665 RepID=UPI0027DCD581|nr:LacI family DNA-binding transcriptional regulator [Lentzea nigeriaca]MBM7858833.1 LacI family transcriptional regulator [Lentzea nigeriaca]
MSKRVTINDVARTAGVSRQTVSRALNDKGEIDGSTKQRVLDAARELGYRPSRFARGLVRQDTTTIGLVIPDLLNPFFTEVAAGALEAARARGWHVIVYDTAGSDEEERGTIEVVVSQVDAVVGYFNLAESELDAHLSGMPAVLIGREHQTPRFSSIRIEGAAGVREAVDHLVANGHRRIGMLDYEERSRPSIRHSWFADAMSAHGLVADAVGNAVQSVDGGTEALTDLLARRPDLTAVFAFNDVIAVGALRAARRLGRAVPDELAVVGFDGLQLGTVVDPALTSVALDTRRVGALAIEQAGRLLAREPQLPPEELLVNAVLLVREST